MRSQASDGPNIVLISTDDQALVDLRWMPLTRRLIGDQGVNFSNFIAPHPLCCPARAQILTGQYAQNNGVRGNRGQHGGYQSLDDPEHTLPVWLRDAGYRTSFVGKYVNGYHPDMGIPAGWEDWDATVRLGYQHFLQYDGSAVTQPEGYHTDYVAERTTEEIAALAADDQPFFLWSSFYAPHGICSATHEIGCSTPPPVAPQFARSFRGVRGAVPRQPVLQRARRVRQAEGRHPGRQGRRRQGEAAVPPADPLAGVRGPGRRRDRDRPARGR